MTDAFWSEPADTLLAGLGSTRTGLAPAEASARLARVGPNQVGGQQRVGWPRLLLRQIASPLSLILVFGAAISLALGEWLDASIILAIVGGSALLSFIQEFRANTAVAALESRLALQSDVQRNGATVSVPAATLVPGDVVLLSAGKLVPADGLVLDAQDCLVTEASLTGESLPVEKRPGVVAADAAVSGRSNCLFMGSSLRSGTATLLVVETGARTQFGAIAERLRAAEPETEFARGVRHFGGMLLRVMIVIVLAVLTVNQLLGRPVIESLLFAVALAVGLSPELLPAIISVTLAAGARHLAAEGVIVRRLDAIENLGSIDVLCTDKTGTLTAGEIRLKDAVDANGAVSADVRAAAFLNSAFETGIANPLDAAVVSAGKAAGLDTDGWKKAGEIPYDFARRRLSVLVDAADGSKRRLITKGAFDDVMAICTFLRGETGDVPLDDAARARIDALYQAQGEAGLRVLAVAERAMPAGAAVKREDEAQLTLLGLLLFLDPPRADAAATIGHLAGLGITIKIISGDNRHVTQHVANIVGLGGTLLTGAQVAAMSDAALRVQVDRAALFAEIDPQQKERIIAALQRAGHAVGYMGDGINDAPALRLADVGISVDQAVDVARASADVVLMRQGLDVLCRGVADGRRTFVNTMKYIAIATAGTFGNMVSMAIATPLLPFLPLLPKQILLNNFLADIPSLSIATDRVDAEQVTAPQRWNIHEVQRFMIVFGLISSCFDMVTFFTLLRVFHASAAQFQTSWFVVSLLTELLVLQVLRTHRPAWRSRGSALLLAGALAMSAVALALPYLPLAREGFGFVALTPALLGVSLVIVCGYVAATEATKLIYYRKRVARRR